jgi:putative hydrolase of HD superfamily
VKRSGWWIAGIENPESVAEHSFRTAVIAYLLAELEGVNTERATFMALFHDAGEARTNDLHRIARRYVDWENVDKKVAEDQSKRLPEHIRKGMMALNSEYEEANSVEARIARDADLLECLIQAREYQTMGCDDVSDWISNARAALLTDSAKKIAEACMETEPREWWQGLKKQ